MGLLSFELGKIGIDQPDPLDRLRLRADERSAERADRDAQCESDRQRARQSSHQGRHYGAAAGIGRIVMTFQPSPVLSSTWFMRNRVVVGGAPGGPIVNVIGM